MFIGLLIFSGVAFFALIAVMHILTEFMKSQAQSKLRAEQVEQLTELKRQMIDRGMSAEDIERVVHAHPPQQQEPTTSEKPNESSSADPDILLSTKMAEHDVPLKAMEAILSAIRSAEPATRQKAAMAVASMLDYTDVSDDDSVERIVVAVRSLCLATPPGEPRHDDRISREVFPLERGAL